MEKYLNKFYDFIDKVGKHNFILITFIIIVLIVTGLYQTFSLYTESEEVAIIDGVETYSFILNPDNNTNTVTIAAGNSKNLDITVYNKSDVDLLYGIYYTSSDNLDDVVIYSSGRTAYSPNGTISSNSSYVVTVKVNNFSDNDVTINFGMKYGFENAGKLALNDGESWIMPLNSMITLFTSGTDYSYFKNDAYREKIVNASFIKSVDTSNASIDESGNPIVWDISVEGDGSILAWLEQNETTSSNYNLYIGSNNVIFSENLSYYFCNLINLQNISFDNLNTSMTTDMLAMFASSKSNDSIYMSLTSLDLSNFNTSSVTNMYSMFFGCGNLTTLDISSFDTSSVTTMRTMFYDCRNLTSLDLSNFDTSNVTTMENMFFRCYVLVSLNISNFNTSKVTNMSSMFSSCQKLSSLDLSNFNTSKVTDMSYMFDGCQELNSLDLSNFNTSKVTNMKKMFNNCVYLTTLDLSSFDTTKVIDMSYMFYGCSSLTTLDLSSFDTSNVTAMGGMFSVCKNLSTTITITNINETTYSAMFANAATIGDAQIIVYYTNETSNLVDLMIATKSSASNVVKGSLVS